MKDVSVVKAQIEEILKARSEFFAELDRQVPKVAGTDVFDFTAVKQSDLKALYAKFYAYDYNIRKLLPNVYEAFGVNFNV
jgi:chain length determinant protein